MVHTIASANELIDNGFQISVPLSFNKHLFPINVFWSALTLICADPIGLGLACRNTCWHGRTFQNILYQGDLWIHLFLNLRRLSWKTDLAGQYSSGASHCSKRLSFYFKKTFGLLQHFICCPQLPSVRSVVDMIMLLIIEQTFLEGYMHRIAAMLSSGLPFGHFFDLEYNSICIKSCSLSWNFERLIEREKDVLLHGTLYKCERVRDLWIWPTGSGFQ